MRGSREGGWLLFVCGGGTGSYIRPRAGRLLHMYSASMTGGGALDKDGAFSWF